MYDDPLIKVVAYSVYYEETAILMIQENTLSSFLAQQQWACSNSWFCLLPSILENLLHHTLFFSLCLRFLFRCKLSKAKSLVGRMLINSKVSTSHLGVNFVFCIEWDIYWVMENQDVCSVCLWEIRVCFVHGKRRCMLCLRKSRMYAL